ncbi:hypothetical protein [Ancylobacter terrae]|uniref:hypothetical protein n=1 Tax=Ancylobacter sp. sgz301288 TaxID=3342077 RepID=UPI0038588CA5
MAHLLVARLLVAVALLAALGLGGCAVRLAPDYDAALVTGIQKANEEAMVLFAGVGAGTKPATFPKRADAYANVIGKLDALRVSALARLAPSAPGFLGSGKLPDAPTPQVLEEASTVMIKMRDTDAARGLSPMLVGGFREAFGLSIQQALVYERALQR